MFQIILENSIFPLPLNLFLVIAITTIFLSRKGGNYMKSQLKNNPS